MAKNPRVAILLFAGKSERFLQGEENLPKQFYPIHGIPLFLYPLNSLITSGLFQKIYLVYEKSQESYASSWIEKYYPDITGLCFVPGGENRNQSVRFALEAIRKDPSVKKEDLKVFIHDAARAYLPLSVLNELDKKSDDYDALTPVIRVSDSIMKNGTYLDRNNLLRIQTPQVCSYKLLDEAYQKGIGENATDDYSKVISIGGKGCLIKGTPLLYKVTYEQDIELMERLLKSDIFDLQQPKI